MSVLFIDFPGPDRNSRVQKLAKTGAHIVATEPRWPGFFELAKKEKPYAIAIDFEQAPAHSLETADYIAKSKETRDATIYLLRVPQDRLDIVTKRLPQAAMVTDQELAVRVSKAEAEARERARQKKEAAAAARRSARARAGAERAPASARPKAVVAKAGKALPKAAKKTGTPKKKATSARAARSRRKR
jgi:hypothetical protein